MMMDELQCLRKTLKVWETSFNKDNNRKPNKNDIDNAPTEIKETYAKYSKLKKSAVQKNSSKSSEDFQNYERKSTDAKDNEFRVKTKTSEGKTLSDGAEECNTTPQELEEDVWGRKFDKKVFGNNMSAQLNEEKDAASCNMFLQKLGSKLFENSKKIVKKNSSSGAFNKSWKKQTFTSDEIKNTGNESFFQNETIFKDESIENENLEGDTKLSESKFSMFHKAASFASLKPRQSLSDNASVILPGRYNMTPKRRSKIPSIAGSTYTAEDIEDSNKGDNPDVAWDEVDGMVLSPVSRKSNRRSTDKSLDEELWVPDDEELAKIKGKHCKDKNEVGTCETFNIDNTTDSDTIKQRRNKETTRNKGSSSAVSKEMSFQSKKSRKTRQERTEVVAMEEVITASSEIDQESFLKSESKIVEKTQSETRNPRSQFDFMEEDVEVPIIPKQYKKRKADQEEDGSNKRRKMEKSQKKPKSLPKDVDVETDDNTLSIVPKSSAAPVRKAVSNQNFVRLNMKVKTYKRKGKGMTGPQMKRFQWKQKMKARSASYGDKCFKCGQEGHWASKCKVKKSSGFNEMGGGESPAILEEDFPSLQEAAMMAKGVKVNRSVKSEFKDSETLHTTNAAATPGGSDEEDAEEIQIEADIVRTAPEEVVAPTPMSPLHKAEDSTCITEVPAYVKDGLKKFGYSQFRQGQQRAIMRILSGLSTLVVLSTGGGKSLCYQLPAYLYSQRSKSITLVISPLVSLMEDQITGLPPGVRGACLHTNMTPAQREGVLSAVKEGKIHFLLISPEAVAGGGMTLLNVKESLPPIAFVCIDEAHCLSEWSHNFRPSYLRLCKVLREKFGVQCFLGLTATATKSTAADVAKHLGIDDLEEAVIRGIPVPANLNLSVSRDEDKDGAFLGMLQGKRFSECESIIVYCTRRQQTDRLATLIRTCLKEKNEEWEEKSKKKGYKKTYAFWDAESYHAGLTPAQRKRVQNAFMSGRLRVVVATVAFGMGLDKADVRGIIHYNMPKSFEGYVQEIGRAGRDGKPSHCHLFLDSEGKDLSELRRHTYANTVDYRTLKKFVRKVFLPCHCMAVQKLHQQALQEKDTDIEEVKTISMSRVADLSTSTTGESDNQVQEKACKKRICPGHERAMCIEDTVMDLDVKEEGISTLLCYLELNKHFDVHNLSSVYSTCQLQCYGGPSQLQAIAKKCPPVAVAIAKAKKDGKSFATSNNLSFPVVEISDCMGWNSGLVKRELKMLPWDMNIAGSTGPRKTGVMVEFCDLAFHFRSPGDLDDDGMDDILQFLHDRVQQQEKSELQQLNHLYHTLKRVSHKNYWMCSDDLDQKRNEKLRSDLRDYFQDQETVLQMTETPQVLVSSQDINQAVADVHQFINIYGQDHKVNGRSLARIFHGIASPCYPASTWGRVHRFWRSHMHIDFNELVKIATKEIIRMR